MGGSLLHLLAYFLGVLVDPTRWLISGLAGWFIQNLYLGMAVSSVIYIAGLAMLSFGRFSGPLLIIHVLASSLVTFMFFSWRKNRRK